MSTTRFEAGTFTPRPAPAPLSRVLGAQARMELTLFLRNGEQLLITMVIPIALLIGLRTVPGLGEHNINDVLPGVLMVAVMGTAFTGQAIAVGFDRRYGALKRLAATGLSPQGMVAGKTAAVAGVVVLQCLVLGILAVVLGWRPDLLGLLIGLLFVIVGTGTFAALGLLLGGTLKAEIVLALANLLWLVLLALGSLVFASAHISHSVQVAARLLPSGALANALHEGFAGHFDWFGLLVLLVWGAVAGVAATRLFKLD